MKIDIHAHMYPEALTTVLARIRGDFPHVEFEESVNGVRFKVGMEEWTRPVPKSLTDVKKREEDLDQKGISLQLNAGWLDITGYSLPPQEGARWSRFLNEQLAAYLAGHPRFLPVATVPLQDGELAAKELVQAKRDGHVGVMIGSYIPGMGDLDSPHLDVFWQAAADESMPVIIHPVFTTHEPRTQKWGMINAISRPCETAVCLARLLYAGVPQRFAGLKLIVSHGGGSLPYLLGRMMRNYELLKGQQDDVFSPAEGFSLLYFDSVVFEPRALEFLLSLSSAERVLLGTDDPFPIGDPNPALVVERSHITPQDRQRIYVDNAMQLFGLSQSGVGGR
ncbi:MAG: amidohydrolase [Alicyclobacillus macrosporangiidus]|uniref:amidohydrolase family protein n=1 Tax=Alicyclobacillus macrosporangiidus TaxID=392015 RepID=UPI0026F0CA64|nr:amidohydrolase family protein [Alicyclobacillus macrosporangiidus]MCL6598908.1 amidohydrolase [Alicyclobacillus macrosporangiidus]